MTEDFDQKIRAGVEHFLEAARHPAVEVTPSRSSTARHSQQTIRLVAVAMAVIIAVAASVVILATRDSNDTHQLFPAATAAVPDGSPDPTGVSGESTTSATAVAAVSTPSSTPGVSLEYPLGTLLDVILFGGKSGVEIEQALQNATATCMAAAGHPYTASDAAAIVQGEDASASYATIVQHRKTDGYGIVDTATRASVPDPNLAYQDSLPADQQLTYQQQVNGCYSTAQTGVYADIPYYNGSLQAAATQFSDAVKADPGMQKALTDWSTCMAGHGYTEANTNSPHIEIEHKITSLAGDVLTAQSANLKAEEVSLAVADSACYENTILPAREALEPELIKQLAAHGLLSQASVDAAFAQYGFTRTFQSDTSATTADLQPLAQLTPDQWVVPTNLPDGFIYHHATFDADSKSVTFSNHQLHASLIVSIHDSDTTTSDTTQTTQPINGLDWTTTYMGPTVQMYSTRINNETVTVTASAVDTGSMTEIISGLRTGDTHTFPRPPINLDDPASLTIAATATTESGHTIDLKIATDGVVYCARVNTDSECIVPLAGAPITQLSATILPDGTAVAYGVADPNVARIEIHLTDGRTITALPQNINDKFDINFYLVAGTYSTGLAIDHTDAFDAEGNKLKAVDG